MRQSIFFPGNISRLQGWHVSWSNRKLLPLWRGKIDILLHIQVLELGYRFWGLKLCFSKLSFSKLLLIPFSKAAVYPILDLDTGCWLFCEVQIYFVKEFPISITKRIFCSQNRYKNRRFKIYSEWKFHKNKLFAQIPPWRRKWKLTRFLGNETVRHEKIVSENQ